MKTSFALFRRSGPIGVATICMLVFGISVFGIVQVLAQNENAGEPKNKKSTYAAMAEVPEKAREKENPFAGDTQAVAAGGKLFEQHCAECHGPKAVGT